MSQTLLVVVLFIGAVAMLPWLVRYVQQRQNKAVGVDGTPSRVLSAIAIGPHQRIVTVEVGPAATPPPSGVRFSSHSASGISATIAPNHSSGVQSTAIVRLSCG